MQRIQLLLILFSIASPGNCSNRQVSVIKYKGGNECENDLVGVPIKSTSSMTSPGPASIALELKNLKHKNYSCCLPNYQQILLLWIQLTLSQLFLEKTELSTNFAILFFEDSHPKKNKIKNYFQKSKEFYVFSWEYGYLIS